MFRYIKITQKGLILVVLPLTFELLWVAVLAHQLSSAADEFDKLSFAQRIVYKLTSKSESILNSVILLGNYQNAGAEERSKAADRIIETFKSTYFQGGDPDLEAYPATHELFGETESSRKVVLAIAEQMKRNKDKSPVGTISTQFRDQMIGSALTLRDTYDKIRAFARRLDNAEPDELRRISSDTNAFLLIGLALSCTATLLVAYVFTFDIVRRLRRISNKAYLVAAGRELQDPETGTDEIAELDKAIHKASLMLRASQKKELAILNNAADVVCSLDKQLRFIAVSASSEKIWGYSSDDLIGRSLLTILTRDTASDTAHQFESIVASGLDTEIATILKCKNHTLMDCLWTVNFSAQSQEFVCVAHDVTELKKIEKLKQAFFSMVSHDLRAPLTSININLANITSGNFGEIPKPAEKLIGNSVISAHRLTALVNDLLDLDKLNSGKLILDLECISVREICESAVLALESMASDAGVELVAPSADAAVIADEKRLVQVLTNLISNAIKFSPRNSRVSIQVKKVGELVEIGVTDQGPGIPPEQQSRLFEKYSQGSAVSNVALKGTGLGLAIVKLIIDAHDAEVGIVSNVGMGSTFWIRFKEFVD